MTCSSTSPNLLKSALKKILVACFWVLVWAAAYHRVNQEILIPSPAAVLGKLFSLCTQGGFWLTIFSSFVRILCGLLAALVCGVLLAALTWRFPLFRELLHPLLAVVKATPVASFIILALVWIKTPYLSAFTSFLMVLPLVWENVYTGIGQTDRALLEMGEVFRFSAAKKLREIYLPSILPYFLTACTMGLGLAWKAGIAAEVLGVPNHAIGTQIYQSKIYLETTDLFAWTIVVIVMSMLIEAVFQRAVRRIRRRYLAFAAKGDL